MIFAEIFQGSETGHGYLQGYKPDGKKDGKWAHHKINFEEHFNISPKGLSPVNERKRACRFICGDVDEEIDPKKFCAQVWKIDPELFVFKSLGNRWHVYKFFDDWVDAHEARKLAEDLEKELMEISNEVDATHTLPHYFSLEKNKPGYWIFLPYHKDVCKCYNPRGNPLTKEQFEFRHTWRKHPLIAGSVGLVEEGEGKGKLSRHKVLFNIAIYLHHTKTDLTIEEVNKHFTNPITDTKTYFEHLANQAVKPDYDEEHLKNNFSNYIKDVTGVETKLALNAEPNDTQKKIDELTGDLVKNYVYIRDRTDFFERHTFKFVDKVMLNDWYMHISKKKITDKLLQDPRLIKVHSYLTHAGLPPGVVNIKPRQIPGIEPGVYLNNYQGSDVVSRPGDVSKIIDYYKWLVGESAWKVIEQTISYWIVKPGVKIMWAIVLISKTEGAGKQLLALLIASILGDKNVKTNVAFDMLVEKHSTILEGKQVIVLNEVVMLGTGSERKLLANKLKPYTSDPTLIINPKNKPMIEIPNLCNFFIFSNEENALHLTKDSRRYFVCNIKRKEKEILQKLENEGIKKEILKTIKDPGPLKNYFEKDVIIKDKEVFFSAAPKTEDLQEMIDRSKGDLEKILNTAKEERSFPFCGKVYHETTRGSVHYGYSGLVIRDEFYPKMINDPLFKGIFKSLTLFEEWVKENCIPWPNGELTKQIVMKEDVNKQQEYKRRRAYCIHNQKLEDGRHLIELSEGELGEHHQIFGYLNFNDQEINTMKRRAEKSQETMSNDLHMGRIGQGLDHSDYVAPDHSKQRATGCWSCKAAIDTETDGICEKCDFGIPCGECGKCACDNPSSKLYAKVHGAFVSK